MALVQVEAPGKPALTTPVKSKQKSLFELWSTEKETEPTSEGCKFQGGSHVKLRNGLSGEAIVAFEESLKRVRANHVLADVVREQKKVAREFKLSLRDPVLRGRGIARHGASGRPKGSLRNDEVKTHEKTRSTSLPARSESLRSYL